MEWVATLPCADSEGIAKFAAQHGGVALRCKTPQQQGVRQGAMIQNQINESTPQWTITKKKSKGQRSPPEEKIQNQIIKPMIHHNDFGHLGKGGIGLEYLHM